MLLILFTAVTIPVFAIAFFCLLPAYIFNRQGVRESLLLLEDGCPRWLCLAGYACFCLEFSLSSFTQTAMAANQLFYGEERIIFGGLFCFAAALMSLWTAVLSRRAFWRIWKKHPIHHRIRSLLSTLLIGTTVLFLDGGIGSFNLLSGAIVCLMLWCYLRFRVQ
ncbi:MAG: hypothetical protein IKA55_05120 [Akkermansia sp.]|nr:hypothetical protein [Akkermansia sp.]